MQSEGDESVRQWRVTWQVDGMDELDCLAPHFDNNWGHFIQLLPPGLLPSGLRVLHLGSSTISRCRPAPCPPPLPSCTSAIASSSPYRPVCCPPRCAACCS